MSGRQPKRRALTGWILTGLLVVLGVAAVWLYPFIPGTLRFDPRNGMSGTGTEVYRYPDGSAKLIDKYRRGKLLHSTWYKPDGSVLATTAWKDGNGIGYYLRDDGTIKSRMTYVNGLADGTATYFNPDGSVAGEAEFKAGQRISGYKPPPQEAK